RGTPARTGRRRSAPEAPGDGYEQASRAWPRPRRAPPLRLEQDVLGLRRQERLFVPDREARPAEGPAAPALREGEDRGARRVDPRARPARADRRAPDLGA